MSHSVRIALVAVFLAAWGGFGWRSWSFVRRRMADRDALPVRRHGLTFVGGGMLLTLTLQQSLYSVDAPLAEAVRMPGFWLRLPLQLLIVFPLALWGEYVFYSMLKAGLQGFGFRPPPRQ